MVDIDGTGGNNAIIENCYTRGNIFMNTSGLDAGGIALVVGAATISNVYSTVRIDRGAGITTSAGGLFSGVNVSASIAGTNYFVDDAGGADGITVGMCEPTATCVRGYYGYCLKRCRRSISDPGLERPTC